MYFSANITPLVYALLGVALAALLYVVAVYLLRVRRVVTNSRRPLAPPAGPLPGASVIVCSRDEAYSLEPLLNAILEQDYSGPFEVIVVNEGDSIDVRDLVERLSMAHTNIYLTHTPEGAVSLSRKKLAITLGVKAARYPVVVLTTALASIPERHWLSAMMSPFADPAVEIVLGSAAIDGPGRVSSFQTAADEARWLADALSGHPWRGTEFNLAYRREAFFRNKGFSRSLNLRQGDDDIFISEIARGGNTAVCIAPDSIVHAAALPYAARRRRRNFTERRVRRRPRIVFPLMWWAHPVALVATAVAAVLGWPNLVPAVAAAVLLLLMAVADVLTWRPVLAALGFRKLLLTIPLLSLWRPIHLLAIRLSSPFDHQKRYTWD